MLLIRKDTNRVLAFNTITGRQLALDNEGGEVLIHYLKDNKAVSNRSFLLEIFEELAVERTIDFRIMNSKAMIRNRPFEVLDYPVLVDLQITTKCNLSCPHCYANGIAGGYHLAFSEIKKIIDQCSEMGVFELALGGGEPTLHPDFQNILRYAQSKGVVPNLATNGYQLSDQHILDIARFSGAIALSVEFVEDNFKKRRGFEFADWLSSFKRLKRAGIKVVFQLTVSQESIKELASTIKYLRELKPHGIIFLTYKPYGRGLNYDAPLSHADIVEVQNTLKTHMGAESDGVNIGYDCCMGNGLVGLGLAGDEQIKGCSALRSSLAINANLDVVPCSFSAKVVGNLAKDNLADLWVGQNSETWRDNFQQKIDSNYKCSSCTYKINCLGGCPEFKLINCYKETPLSKA